ncbi:MAG TPA: hypothetical protein VIX83_09425 [Candidatus Cybelea sp.]
MKGFAKAGTIGVLVFFGLLAGCGGSQQRFSPAAAGSAQLPAASHRSWIKAGASAGPLVYAGGYSASAGPVTFMFSYPDGKIVGTLDDVGEGMCSDAEGNVYLTHGNSATEYAHGGTTPIRTLRVAGSGMYNCSVDPTTGNVALTLDCPPCGYIDIAIFPPGSSKPLRLNSGNGAWTCGYDGSGNLFVNDSLGTALRELPRGSSDFQTILLDKQIGYIGQVQWDGKHMTLQQLNHPGWIYRFSLSGTTAHILTPTKFKMDIDSAGTSWIYGKSVVIPFSQKETEPNELGIWPYPRGRRAIKLIRQLPSGDRGFGAVTISAAPSGSL